MTVCALFDVVADRDQSIVSGFCRPAIEPAHDFSFDKTDVGAVGPSLLLMIGIMNRADNWRACQTSGDATDDVGGPQVTVNQIGLVRQQPRSQVFDPFGNLACVLAVQGNDRYSQSFDWFQPVSGVRVDRD